MLPTMDEILDYMREHAENQEIHISYILHLNWLYKIVLIEENWTSIGEKYF